MNVRLGPKDSVSKGDHSRALAVETRDGHRRGRTHVVEEVNKPIREKHVSLLERLA